MRHLSRTSTFTITTAVAALVLVGCSAGGKVQTLDGAKSPASALPSTGVSTVPAAGPNALDSTTAVLVLRAYRGFWAAQVQALNSGKVVGSGLQTYATGAALSAVDSDAFRLGQNGLLMSGTVRNNPKVTAIGAVATGSGAQSATLTDCLDVTSWHQVDQRTRQLRDPTQRLTRYQVLVTARTVGGVWMVSQVQNQTGKPC